MDQVGFIAPKAADVKPIIKMQRNGSGSDQIGYNPFGLEKKCLFSLHPVLFIRSLPRFRQAMKGKRGKFSLRPASSTVEISPQM